ncbi:hypothetical protein Bca52824_088033 [Brassica carinata]|uniref:Uncharacterized protein n=1 Tax=Brassica carinata TaxID=52824 RepID=A0A8X7PBV3_BRACI|nr:hypothetical protein Bca52824_088033 [Brassica carinata]
MDSTNPLNPYSDSPSYSYLLHCQNFQYGSYPSSQNFGGGSEIPPFSSQQTDAPASQECSQTSSTTVGDQEVRPEGSKAAKARRNNTQGIKSIAEYTTVMELKKEDLMMKERLSKLAILDTLLAKPGPLSLFKMGRYSNSQPSDSSEYGGEISEPYEYSETEDLIRRDQEELSLKYDEKVLRLVLRLEQLVCDLAKKKSSFINGFEVFIGVMLIVFVLLGLVIVLK